MRISKLSFWVAVYLASAGGLLALFVLHRPLYDPRPPVNLTLRFLMMDLAPLLWVLSRFWGRLGGPREFSRNLWTRSMRHPAPLAAPVLAVILFFQQSLLGVARPSTAEAVTPLNVLWMQGAAALMAVLVFSYGAKGKWGQHWGKKPSAASHILFWILLTGGLAYFLATSCDISRLLVLMGVVGWGFQEVVRAKT